MKFKFLRNLPLKPICFLVCLSFPFNSLVFGQGKWELKRNENEIQVYSRAPSSGNLKEIRVLCQFNTSKSKLIQLLQDINGYHKWVYSTKENKILKIVNSNQLIYYSVSHLPWPLKDRDLIVELTVIEDNKNNRFQVQVKSLPDFLPKDQKYVRVPYSLALWNVTILNDHTLKIDYTFSVDPGGSIPAWLVNSTLPIGPYNSFFKLKSLLEHNDSPY